MSVFVARGEHHLATGEQRPRLVWVTRPALEHARRRQRPALGVKRRMGSTTAGVNLDLPGGRNRIILEYVAHRTGTPFVTKDAALAQWQVKF